jgi:hypothetical protein
MTRRYTITDLRHGIDEINSWLEAAGALVRFEEHGRNGYQAVDEYPIDQNGQRVGSGVNRMVGSGTSRETYQEAHDAYQGIVRNLTT